MGGDILTQLAADLTQAEEWLLNYKARRKQYVEDSNAIRGESNSPEVYVRTGPNKNIVVQKICSLAELESTEKWLLAAEFFEEEVADDFDRLFLRTRREAHERLAEKTVGPGRPAWRPYVAAMIEAKTGDKISNERVTEWWAAIVELFRLVAMKRNCC